MLAPLLRGEGVDHQRRRLPRRHPGGQRRRRSPSSLMLSALAPRLLRVAGEPTDGTILWMGNARSIESHVAPTINAAAAAAGRPAPRIVAGLPVAVHDDVAEARETAATSVRQLRRAAELPAHPRHRRRRRARPTPPSSATRPR